MKQLVNGELVDMAPAEIAEFEAFRRIVLPLTVDDYRRAIQALIDSQAPGRSYDSGLTCASYVGSTNPVWTAEAQAFVAWRDAVWVYAYAELAKVASVNSRRSRRS
ncbi:MAG: hypothetical protein GY873_07930 [Bosea sp.]|uniref:hypothetical protein n=1 Tax=Bosea sp. (in: a-proteobacteria) TaxID=1871050 RepID=UPI0023A77841|nr:hypothetical protein [Bosea sp. (in: a-proteobacteria)]MCP4734108.1 hypothetical protein [Bosea sp. (in: a-proteobacteria)]